MEPPSTNPYKEVKSPCTPKHRYSLSNHNILFKMHVCAEYRVKSHPPCPQMASSLPSFLLPSTINLRGGSEKCGLNGMGASWVLFEPHSCFSFPPLLSPPHFPPFLHCFLLAFALWPSIQYPSPSHFTLFSILPYSFPPFLSLSLPSSSVPNLFIHFCAPSLSFCFSSNIYLDTRAQRRALHVQTYISYIAVPVSTWLLPSPIRRGNQKENNNKQKRKKGNVSTQQIQKALSWQSKWVNGL